MATRMRILRVQVLAVFFLFAQVLKFGKAQFLTAEAVLVIAFTPPTPPPPLQFRKKLF